jgi:hypothetical protein
VKKVASLLGIGPVTVSAVVASVGEFKQFTSGAQFGACVGLVPRQHSSGGKNNLGGITKRGDTYLRSLLIQGAKSAVMTARQALGPDLEVGGGAARPLGLAEGGGGAGQQECTHPVGGDDQERGVRCPARQRQAGGHTDADANANADADNSNSNSHGRIVHNDSITQQASSQKMHMTGQTGSGQARLTLGGSMRRRPRDWNGAPLSGSHLGPHHTRITRRVQQGRLQRSSLFLVHALHRRLLLLQP